MASDTTSVSSGVGLGSVAAFVMTYVNGHDLLWSIIHAFFGWFYVIFYLFGGR